MMMIIIMGEVTRPAGRPVILISIQIRANIMREAPRDNSIPKMIIPMIPTPMSSGFLMISLPLESKLMMTVTVTSYSLSQHVCVCLLLQDLLQSCSRGGEEESRHETQNLRVDWNAEFRNAESRFSQLLYHGQTLVVQKLTESRFGIPKFGIPIEIRRP